MTNDFVISNVFTVTQESSRGVERVVVCSDELEESIEVYEEGKYAVRQLGISYDAEGSAIITLVRQSCVDTVSYNKCSLADVRDLFEEILDHSPLTHVHVGVDGIDKAVRDNVELALEKRNLKLKKNGKITKL